MKMKKLLAFLLALSMVLALTACTDDSGKEPGNSDSGNQLEDQQDQENLSNIENANNDYIKDQVTIAYKTATSLTNWGTNNDTPGNYSVYEMLYECDTNGDMYPLLADGTYEGSYMPGCDHEDGTGVYTVKIYDYIVDHWGNPVTAEDIAFSFMYQFENESTSGWQDLVSVEAADPTTVVFTFTEDQNGVGELLNIFCRCFIVSKASFEKSESGLVNEMCGTGPYKMAKYTSGSELTLEMNEDYWQKDELRRQEQQANVKTIVYKFIDESAQRVVALKTGTVDYVHEMESSSAGDFADGGEFADQFNVYTYRAKFVYYLTPNCSEKSICSDINMRLAILNAIDQDGLVTALGGTDTRINGYMADYAGYYDFDWVDWASKDNYNTRTGVDAAQVKSYLDAAGYNNEKVTLVATGLNSAAEVVAAQLTAVGINVDLKTLDFSAYRSAIADPSAWDLDLGMMAGSEIATVWQHAFSYSNTAEGNMTSSFVVNDEWDALLNEICTEAGHTPENMEKWWDIAVENAYTMGLYNANTYDIVPEDMTYVCLGDKLTPLPGACTYAAPEG